ncbi:MAG TPA: response regulator transcription factor [Caulobacteraceae bacterium]
MRLLVVEDNEELAELLMRGFEAESFDVDHAETAEDASEALRDTRYAAVVLDLGLPDRDGSAVLREMRGRKDGTPVLVLTARGGLHERIAGLQNGADDYLVKPFAFEELVARLRALLRRPGEMLGRVLQTANLALDTEGRQAFVDGKAEPMSAQELTLLEVLLRRAGKVVPKSYIEDQLFGMTSEVGKSAVEVSVYRLRKRLETMGAKVEIHTVRGLGYLLADTHP